MNGLVRRSFLSIAAAGLAAPAAFAQTRAEWAAVGQYGDRAAPVTLFEQDGALHLFGKDLPVARLTALGGGRHAVAGGGEVTLETGAIRLNGARLLFDDFGAETQAAIQRAVRADPVALRQRALAATPPVETEARLPADLVDLTDIDPRIRLDIRYAGADNFMGIPLYERAAAWLQRPAAEALGRVQHALAGKGFGLLIHDAYRPWFVTWMFWEATPVREPRLRRRSGPGLAPQSRLRCRPDAVRSQDRQARRDAQPLRRVLRPRLCRLHRRHDAAAGPAHHAARRHDRRGF